VLKPDGRLYAATNGGDTMRELDELVERLRPPRSQSARTVSLISDRRLRTGFNLEHGASELGQWFSSVSLHRYDDALIVPDAEPLVAYVKAAGYLPDDQLALFKRHVEARIQRDGSIHISKNCGMFEAYGHGSG
jgi:hypothetical protein